MRAFFVLVTYVLGYFGLDTLFDSFQHFRHEEILILDLIEPYVRAIFPFFLGMLAGGQLAGETLSRKVWVVGLAPAVALSVRLLLDDASLAWILDQLIGLSLAICMSALAAILGAISGDALAKRQRAGASKSCR
jgi:hypothetical protein